MWHKGVRWHRAMLNPIFWKKVLGQKHHGRWEIAEHQIPSIKKLFKTNTKGHKHPGIRLFIIEQYTIGEPKKTEKSCNRTHIKNAYIYIHTYIYVYTHTHIYMYIYIYTLTQSFWAGTKVIRSKHIQFWCNTPISICKLDGKQQKCCWISSDLRETLSMNHISQLTHLPLVPHIKYASVNRVSIGSDTVVQIMACRLFGNKPLSN